MTSTHGSGLPPAAVATRARFQALAYPGEQRTGYRIHAAAESTSATIYLYDSIGGWFGIKAAEFVRELTALDVDQITVHINSPGGDVFDGIAIMNALRHHRAQVTTVVDGLAASSASFIAVGAGSQCVMAKNAQVFIHDAWGVCIGSAVDLRDMADSLDKVSDNIASVYMGKAGGSVADWRATMLAETWYSDAEAVEAGLADRVEEDTSEGDEQGSPAAAAWDLSVFAHAGRKAAPAPPSVTAARYDRGGNLPSGSTTARNTTGRAERLHTPPAAPAAGSNPPAAPAPGDTSQKGAAVAFTEEQLNTMRQAVGVSNDADEQTILDALAESLQERADAAPSTTNQGIPEGTTLIDEGTLAQLRDDAQAGREARTQQQAERREAQVQTAIRQGQIPPSRADAWRGMLAADPGAAQTLAALPTGTVPLEVLGHADTGPQSADPVDQNLAAMGWGPTDTKEA